ncbi:hypothetical protein LZK82_16775 [Rhizobium leguminosarum]|nr:hypothetical protein LZK82_16775 [Rhizobium leguminosarum]UIK09671.1 hypothetical protein LZK80_16905 [Rhizobium leguminosarum]UIL26851.1 hypothetical protein LZK75_16900 [Rhizobium leguminosarum]
MNLRRVGTNRLRVAGNNRSFDDAANAMAKVGAGSNHENSEIDNLEGCGNERRLTGQIGGVLEIYSRVTGGETLHITQGNGPPLEGWGIDGLKVILTTLEHQDVDGGPQLYSHIEDALLGDYDLRADLTATDIVNLRFHVSGQIYYYWNRFDYYDGEALPNQCRENPDEEDADVNLEGLTAIEIERTGDKVEAAFLRFRKRMDELGLGSFSNDG